jgi:inner membrane protein
MGEAFAGKKLGKKAMLWGAMAQSVPDIDFLASFWMNTSSNLLAHRGFTHSFLFCAIITPLLALLAGYLHRPHNISLSKWLQFFGGTIFVHIFIDAFNNYGVGWFEPFNHVRISFNAIYVADPFFSIWVGLAFLTLLLLKCTSALRKKVWVTGLAMSGLYLIYTIFNKTIIDRDVKEILQKQQIVYSRYFTTPAPLQNWLWYVVAESDSGYHIGFHSFFDSKKQMSFQYFPRNKSLLSNMTGNEDLFKLIRFSKQYYTIEQWHDTLVFNDLRFGQIIGWQNPKEKFVFHYFLTQPHANTMVVQRGRFEGWDMNVFFSLLKRIKGE